MPLIKATSGPAFPQSWTRHYIQRSVEEDGTCPATVILGDQADFSYDAYAELVFKDEAAFKTFYGIVNEKGTLERLKKEEEKFLDRARFRMVLLDETTVTEKEGRS